MGGSLFRRVCGGLSVWSLLCSAASTTGIAALAVPLVDGEQALIELYVSRRNELVPLLPPDPGLAVAWSGNEPVAFLAEGFEKGFFKKLPYLDANGIRLYPLTVLERPDTRERVILDADGNAVGCYPAASEYDPWDRLDRMNELTLLWLLSMEDEALEWWLRVYDPCRVHWNVLLVEASQVQEWLCLKAALGLAIVTPLREVLP